MTIVRNTKLYAMLVAAVFSLTSCLDKVPGSAIPEEEALQTYQEAEQFLTGIYAKMMNGSLWSGYLTLVPEIQSDLAYAVEGYSNVYGNIWQWDIRPTNAEIEAIYGSLYSLIANCNFFLERVDQIIAKQTIDEHIQALDYYKGEVYAIRALCYSELIKCFCKAYDPATAQSELGVVLRTKYSTPEPSSRASLADSYALVLDDLKKAEELLDVENDYYGAFYMTNASVCALRARVALNMQDWQTAIDYATKLIDHPEDTFALANANVAYTPQLSYFDYMWQH
ncbi:MAG: RagB/SusD family nutrient uptake outer membrane protein, partial [Alistipes sp.]|nr:RagB/SusD family nutrient uptake outer membrane protein [Alistipes sp.]